MAGLVGMLVCLIITGGLGCVNSKSASTGVGVLLVIQTLINMTTIGPACYPIVAETPSGRLRAKTITIGVSRRWTSLAETHTDDLHATCSESSTTSQVSSPTPSRLG